MAGLRILTRVLIQQSLDAYKSGDRGVEKLGLLLLTGLQVAAVAGNAGNSHCLCERDQGDGKLEHAMSSSVAVDIREETEHNKTGECYSVMKQDTPWPCAMRTFRLQPSSGYCRRWCFNAIKRITP